METLFSIIAGYDRGLVGLLLIIISMLLWLHVKENVINKIKQLEQHNKDHDDRHLRFEEKCRDRHEYKGVDRRKP